MSDATDWISAGANLAAAVGTVGALWVGAVTLRRQVNDQHRAQASAVTVGAKIVRPPLQEAHFRCFIANGSTMPIYRVGLMINFDGNKEDGHTDVLEPGDRIEITMRPSEKRKVLGEFMDSSGNVWLRNDKGKLIPWTQNNWWQGRKILVELWWMRHKPKLLRRGK